MRNNDHEQSHPTALSPTEARQAEPTGRVRYILGISLGLSCLALLAVWVFGLF